MIVLPPSGSLVLSGVAVVVARIVVAVSAGTLNAVGASVIGDRSVTQIDEATTRLHKLTAVRSTEKLFL